MKMFRVLAAAAAAGLFAIAGAPAQASIIGLSGGTAGTIPDAGQTNDVLVGMGLGNSLTGFFGSTVSVVGSAPILVEFLGYEAGYANSFSFAGHQFSSEVDDPTPADNREIFTTAPSFVTSDLSGVLDFFFSTSGGGTPASVQNGANPDDFGQGPTGVSFFASIVGAPMSRSGQSVMLFFDDNGANNDDDYDDMVIRLSSVAPLAAVPLPATLPLLFGAIAGFGFVGRRSRRAA